jgi:RNA polymerase sigma-70 factor (ECF subfamily)
MDHAVIDRARAGDRDAMERVLESVAPSIRRFAAGMCQNHADADDVVQDALLSIATNLDSFEGRSAFTTWAFTLARTACSRRRRGLKNRPAEGDEVLETQPSEARGPEESTASQELRVLVARALDMLPEDYRTVLILRDGEGLTAPEAAEVLAVSVDALKSRLHRARAALREALTPMIDGDLPQPGPDCPDVIATLSRKIEDDLDAQTCAQMEEHVESCRACARVCDTLKSALRACRSAPGEVPEQVKAQVKKAVAAWVNRRAAASSRQS